MSFAAPAPNMPPDKPIEWSPKSKGDLAEIWAYYARAASPEFADAFIRKIARETERIGRHPTPDREHEEFRGLRRLLVHPYTVFFRVSDKLAEVARVLHEQRDFPSAFGDEI